MENIERIEKIFRMLGSTHDGEIINAVNSIRKILLAQDKNFSDLANKIFCDIGNGTSSGAGYKTNRSRYPGYDSSYDDSFRREYKKQQKRKQESIDEYRRMAEYLINMPTLMSNWESTFISDIYNRQLLEGHELSMKQHSCLWQIYKRYYSEKSEK